MVERAAWVREVSAVKMNKMMKREGIGVGRGLVTSLSIRAIYCIRRGRSK